MTRSGSDSETEEEEGSQEVAEDSRESPSLGLLNASHNDRVCFTAHYRREIHNLGLLLLDNRPLPLFL